MFSPGALRWQREPVSLLMVSCSLMVRCKKPKQPKQGTPGPQGKKGDTGSQGLAGPQGDAGFTSAISPVPKTGQTKCYETGDPADEISCSGTGQDGNLQRGFSWPNPRFTDNGDGTVTDNLTSLIWLKNANVPNAKRNWATALSDVDQLNTNGTMNGNSAGDTSNGGGHQTDWRLPNVRELFSLIDFSQFNPALPSGHPFSGFPLWPSHWSSSNSINSTGSVHSVLIQDGRVMINGKTDETNYVWPSAWRTIRDFEHSVRTIASLREDEA